jgi:hypothetical protein
VALTATTTLDRSAVDPGTGAISAHAGIHPTDIAWLSLWMAGTLLSFPVMAVSVRALAGALSAFEMVWNLRSETRRT